MKRWSGSGAHAPFPESLSPAERQAVEALMQTGTYTEAAHLLGKSFTTINSQIQQAFQKAGVKNSVRLIVLYIQARR